MRRACAQCGKLFEVRGGGKYCRALCQIAHRTRTELRRPDLDIGPCLIWTGATNRTGYGQIGADGRKRRVHRYVWEQRHGVKLPSDLVVAHACDQPSCCRVDHLFVGTQADNIADRDRKQRQAHLRGEAHGRAKLTEREVIEIRRRYAAGGISYYALGKEFGVNPGTIWFIVRGECWKHLENEESAADSQQSC